MHSSSKRLLVQQLPNLVQDLLDGAMPNLTPVEVSILRFLWSIHTSGCSEITQYSAHL